MRDERKTCKNVVRPAKIKSDVAHATKAGRLPDRKRGAPGAPRPEGQSETGQDKRDNTEILHVDSWRTIGDGPRSDAGHDECPVQSLGEHVAVAD